MYLADVVWVLNQALDREDAELLKGINLADPSLPQYDWQKTPGVVWTLTLFKTPHTLQLRCAKNNQPQLVFVLVLVPHSAQKYDEAVSQFSSVMVNWMHFNNSK